VPWLGQVTIRFRSTACLKAVAIMCAGWRNGAESYMENPEMVIARGAELVQLLDGSSRDSSGSGCGGWL
jgi:hypothetical protein